MTELPSVFQIAEVIRLSPGKMSEYIRAVYQPIYSKDGLKVAGFEALARLDHPVLGSVPPALFIETAERTGHIGEITTAILDLSCRKCAEWNDGFVSVNISAADLSREDLPELVADILVKTKLHPSRLQIEVTETLAVSCDSHFSVLDRLKNMGIMTAMDDFGTGHAAGARLFAHDWDRVKLDGGVVRACLDSGQSGKAYLNQLAEALHCLGHQVVAEGVETNHQFRLLREMECIDYLQGYALGRPQPM